MKVRIRKCRLIFPCELVNSARNPSCDELYLPTDRAPLERQRKVKLVAFAVSQADADTRVLRMLRRRYFSSSIKLQAYMSISVSILFTAAWPTTADHAYGKPVRLAGHVSNEQEAFQTQADGVMFSISYVVSRWIVRLL